MELAVSDGYNTLHTSASTNTILTDNKDVYPSDTSYE